MPKLTDAVVKALTCPEGRKDALFFDDELRGFGVRVTTGGARSFLLQYNRPTGGKGRVVLGAFGTELTTTQARRKAEAVRGEVVAKRDVVGERREAAAAARAREAQAKATAASAAYTCEKLVEGWATAHLAQRSASYAARTPREVRAVLGKMWLAAPAASLARADAVALLDAAAAERGPVAANRLLAVLRACWGWAMKRGSLTINPWSGIPRPGVEKSRERVLTDVEVAGLWKATSDTPAPFGAIVRLLMLTGQRRSEVAGMAWNELRLDCPEPVWVIPAGRAKNGREHIVPLPPQALTILQDVPRVTIDGEPAALVFANAKGTAPSGFGKVVDRLETRLAAVLAEAGAPVPAPWVLHDIRRTVATGLQRLGVRLEVTEAVLNHVSGSRAGIVGVYQRHGWAKEARAALAAWEGHVLRVAEGKPEAVVTNLRTARTRKMSA
ncbi:tyrosine-type recombinase/integrase [Roseomonas sp. WA12]